MKRLLTTAAMVSLLAIGSANATTILLDYDEQGTALPDGTFLGFDLVGNSMEYNTGDGIEDLQVGENPGGGSGRFSVNSRMLAFTDFGEIWQRGDIARDADNNLITYQVGDEVDSDDFLGTQDTAILYGGTGLSGFPEAPNGILPNVGDSVILGFRFVIEEVFGGAGEGEEGEGLVPCPDGVEFCGGEGDTIFGFSETLEEYFGFFQITRGSVIPGAVGFNTTSGQAAVVTVAADPAPVPLPAAGWLLLAGLGGLGAMRRRNKS